MTATITGGLESITPMLLVDTRHKHTSQNRVHKLLSGRVAVTLARPALPTGVLGFLVKGEEEKEALVQMHLDAPVLSLEDPAQPTTEMTYVLAEGGEIAVEQLMEQGEDLWMIRIDYQEVSE